MHPRKNPRRVSDFETLMVCEGRKWTVTLDDVSAKGAAIIGTDLPGKDAQIKVELLDDWIIGRVCRSDGKVAGVMFNEELSPRQQAIMARGGGVSSRRSSGSTKKRRGGVHSFY